jgi:hypothetical protein
VGQLVAELRVVFFELRHAPLQLAQHLVGRLAALLIVMMATMMLVMLVMLVLVLVLVVFLALLRILAHLLLHAAHLVGHGAHVLLQPRDRVDQKRRRPAAQAGRAVFRGNSSVGAKSTLGPLLLRRRRRLRRQLWLWLWWIAGRQSRDDGGRGRSVVGDLLLRQDLHRRLTCPQAMSGA